MDRPAQNGTPRSRAVLTAVVALAYIAASEIALQLLRVSGDATIVWFATSVGIAALLLRGKMAIPGVFLGALICALMGGKELTLALVDAVLTTSQIALAWWLLIRVLRIDTALPRVYDVLVLALLGGNISPVVNALRAIGATLWRVGEIGPLMLERIGVSYLGEAAGFLLLVPAILSWYSSATVQLRPGQRYEAVLLYAATTIVSVLVFGGLLRPFMNVESLPYALFPLVYWAAFRFGLRQTATVLLVSGSFAVAGHSIGVGPFMQNRISPALALENLTTLYLFLGILALTSLVITAALQQRQAAEARVRESETRYRTLIERMNEGVSITDAEARMIFVSDRFCEMTGYGRGELLGRSGEMLVLPGQHDEWREQQRRRAAISAEPLVLTLRKKGGELLHAWISPRAMFGEDGSYQGSLNVVLDMTDHRRAEQALRESEEKYRLLVENQTDLVLKLDPEGRVAFVSPSYLQFFGLEEDDLLGTPLDLQVHEDERAAFEQAWRACRRPPYLSTVETRVMTPLGWRWLAWSARAMLEADGSAGSVIAAARDVTDRRRAEEQSRQHLQQLAHVARVSSMGEMASAIAHEINQPLAAIANYASACVRLLRTRVAGDDEVLEAMRRVSAEAERAGEIVRRMRGFVRGEEGELSSVDVNYLVVEVLRLAVPEARQNGVEVEIDPGLALPPVHADSIQIQQVLLNLVRNAAEAIAAADCEQREVTIETRRDGDNMVRITVRDSGPGLTPEAAHKAFEPFFTTKPDGIGIGLALSRSIVDAHGGRLWTDSVERGAVFHLSLPVAQELERADA